MTLPFPVIDHVVVNARDRLDEAAALFARLGFTVTPRGRHTLGSINNLAIFGTDYLELIGVEPGDARRTEILEWPEGLNAVVFATEDPAALHMALAQAGIPAGEPVAFSRPVALPDGTRRDATFRAVRLPREAFAAGRLYFCWHATRDLVWRDDWRAHANGAVAVRRVLIAAAQPEAEAALLRRMFGADASRPIPGGLRLPAAAADIDLMTPDAIAARYGAAAPAAAGRTAWMAGLVLRIRDPARAADALRAGGIAGTEHRGDSLIVPAAAAFGTLLEFEA